MRDWVWRCWRLPALVLALAGLFVFCTGASVAQEIEDCQACHEDPDLSTTRDGREVSLFVDLERFQHSVHADFSCVDCHIELIDTDYPHEEEVEDVDCGMCHDDVAEVYLASFHGQKVQEGEALAPQCWDCTACTTSSAGMIPSHR